jgi:tight adherence protein C
VNALQAIATIGVGLLGLALLVRSLPYFRRTTLNERVAPYLGALGPSGSGLFGEGAHPADGSSIASGATALLQTALRDAGARLHRLLGSIDVDARIDASGWNCSVADFRAQEAAWALGSAGGAIAFGMLLVGAGRAISAPAIGMAALVFAVGGVLWRERALDRAVASRRAAMLAELPTAVDLVCLAITAGESLRGAIDIVARGGSGPLARELRGVLRSARSGEPLADALAAAARRIGLAPFDRFVDSVTAAQQRGVPLADALHALAADVREGRKRDLLEAAGRKQVSMLMPVVALILPVAIVFAFYPGVVAIKVLAQ